MFYGYMSKLCLTYHSLTNQNFNPNNILDTNGPIYGQHKLNKIKVFKHCYWMHEFTNRTWSTKLNKTRMPSIEGFYYNKPIDTTL